MPPFFFVPYLPSPFFSSSFVKNNTIIIKLSEFYLSLSSKMYSALYILYNIILLLPDSQTSFLTSGFQPYQQFGLIMRQLKA